LRILPRYATPRRSTEIVRAPKVYGFDAGFVRILRGWEELREEDLGLLWEHYVLNELQARASIAEIRYWRSTKHQEVDFVIVRRGRRPLAVECKWRADGREDLVGMKAFRRLYQNADSVVVASNVDRPFDRTLLPDVTVRYVNLQTLMQELPAP
jgi:predicted AAA+ superfamily ATPase